MTNQPAIKHARNNNTSISSRDSVATVVGFGAVLFTGAIFGFFYAWTSSAMIGFDEADPRVAVAAMQAVNNSIRNAIFFPAFFLTPIVALVAAALHWPTSRSAARWFAAGAVVYLLGGIVLTAVVHIPLNNDLGALTVPTDLAEAEVIWSDYSGRWQFWNEIRTAFSCIALLMCGAGLRAGRTT